MPGTMLGTGTKMINKKQSSKNEKKLKKRNKVHALRSAKPEVMEHVAFDIIWLEMKGGRP